MTDNENVNEGQEATNASPTEEQVNAGIAEIANEGENSTGEANAENASASTEESSTEGSSTEENSSEDVSEVPTAKYKITGLVDTTDEQGNINGQLEVGSEQVLPVEIGDRAVEAGQAERIEE